MDVFEKIKAGLEEAIAYERGALDAVEKKYRTNMKRNPDKSHTLKRDPSGAELQFSHTSGSQQSPPTR